MKHAAPLGALTWLVLFVTTKSDTAIICSTVWLAAYVVMDSRKDEDDGA